MTHHSVSLGISPCPNDTFMFHDLVHGMAPVNGVTFETTLLDIEALNQSALRTPPRFDVSKLSLPALAHRVADYAILSAGAALGRGCGPLVVRRDDRPELVSLDTLEGETVAIPGAHTTAYLLLRIFGPAGIQPKIMRFEDIMPAVAAGEVAAGLIIHESRFTYSNHRLQMMADLGELWEADTGHLLPLGIIAARRSLPDRLASGIETALRRSIENAFADPESSASWVREHAQEMDEEVCRRHIELYVNDYSIDLGSAGRHAIEELFRRGREVSHLPEGGSPFL